MNPDADLAAILKACKFGEKAHEHQKRASGEPYFMHPLEVAEMLAGLRLDTASIITGLLHDTVEDTPVTLADIEREFGAEIASLVDGVTKLSKIEGKSEQVKQAENLRKLVVATSEDIRVLLVKLMDRLHNIRTLDHIPAIEKRRRIAHETMEIYATLAERIGMRAVKDELQDRCFAVLHTDARDSILQRLNFLRKEGQGQIDDILSELKSLMHKNGITATVSGREKKPYSIWRKMEIKNLEFEQLADIMAFRIVVKDIGTCYQALGAVHAAYHMVPGHFNDYISTPKPNGYKSLHTAVIGPHKQRIEIQIRTEEMHHFAEYGVAAHWSYKQGTPTGTTDGKQYRWVRELLDILESAAEPEEFMEHTKLQMYHDQVFCFTPRGDLLELPRGATPVDFAFAVHSDVGRTCVGAKVNGRIVPLRSKLENGDQVEIIRSKTQTPSPSWERFVVTAKARAEIRKYLRQQQLKEYTRLGKAMLVKAFQDEEHEMSDKLLEPALKIFSKKQHEDLYAAVGEGLISRQQVVEAIFPGRREAAEQAKKNLTLWPLKKKQRVSSEHALPIRGLVTGMAVHYAKCCHPLPGDRIMGIIATGKGVTIHTIDCSTLENFTHTPERWIEVAWDQEEESSGVYVGRIRIVVSHEPGSLAAIANIIAKELGNITNLKIINRSSDFFEIRVDMEVRDVRHLTSIIAALRSSPIIQSVERFQE